MKKLILAVLVLVAVGVGAGVYTMRRNQPDPTVTTQPLTRGDIVDTVGATGTLEAVETVDVGTQVSGVVQQLFADFNTIVRKGQVIAKLDPSLIQTQIEQQTANVIRAEADLERLRVALADAKQKLSRAVQMSERKLIPLTELETAEVNVKSAEAQIRSSEAGLTQARAQLNNQRVNLSYTTIIAPIDGIVISRNVDQGQTVASSMNAPTLFIIAADLTKMQVVANIDEADVGRMRPGQNVNFRVDAYPNDTFLGSVQQVRLQPAVVQNVVTYSTVISVPNPELKLKPGMTANVNIEIARRANALRIPNAALRFRPTNEMFAALNQQVPEEMQRGFGRGNRGQGNTGGGAGSRGAAATGGSQQGAPTAGQPPATAPSAQPAQPRPAPQANASASQSREPRAGAAEGRGGGDQPGGDGGGRGGFGRGGSDPNMTPEERQRRREEFMKNMTPEQRERFEARMREGGGRGGQGGPGNPGDARGGGANRAEMNQGGGRNNATAAPQSRTMASGATTIDSLFGPLPVVESRGSAWLYVNKQLKLVRLRLGITDGSFTEIINDEELQPNTEVVTMMTTGLEQRTTPGQGGGQNPLMGPQRGMPGGRGPGGGGGGAGGGGRGRG
jgi:HlyD family secretion protein